MQETLENNSKFFLAGKVFQHNIATLGRIHNLKLFAKYALLLLERMKGWPCECCKDYDPSSIEVTFLSAEKLPYTKKPEI